MTVFNSSPTTPANNALVGDVLEYIVTVNVAANGCAFSAGTVKLTTPNGTVHTLATGVALSPGTSVTYATNNNVGGTPVSSPFTYTVSAADIGKTNSDPLAGIIPLPPGHIDVWSSVSGTATLTGGGTQSSAAFQNYYTQVDLPPTLATSEVTASPEVAPASFTDSATLSGLNNAGSAGGTVTYNLYSGNSSSVCTGTPLQSVVKTVAGGIVPNATFTAVAAGSYEIQAVYSGDAQTSNLGATSTCGAEPFTVQPPTAGGSGTTTTTEPAIAGATVVHTGKPWSGSWPYALAVAVLGMLLVGMGALRRRRSAAFRRTRP